MIWVYIKSEPGLFTVGFYNPSGEWNPESDHDTADTAADRVAYLNGWAHLDPLGDALNSGDGTYRP